MKIVALEQVDKTKMDMEGALDVDKQVPISKNDGSPNFSVRVFTINPGGHTPFHSHPFEHLNYLIQGRGVVVSEGGREQEIVQGSFALIQPDEMHQYKNKSDRDPMVLICAVPKEYE